MMRIALDLRVNDGKPIQLDRHSIGKVLRYKVTQVLNRTLTQCRTHWQKVKQKLRKRLDDLNQQDQRLAQLQEQEIHRAAGLLMDLRHMTIYT